jgi:hypothetical protein
MGSVDCVSSVASRRNRTRRRKAENRPGLVKHHARALIVERLEDRRLLAGAAGISDPSAGTQHQHLADLPVATQQAISSAIGQEQSAYDAKPGMADVSLANPASGFTTDVQEAELTAAGGAAYADFGDAVAISGNTMVVGASGGAVLTNSSGAAYVFTESGDTWTQMGPALTSTGGPASGNFGSSVAISGNTIVVGADGTNNSEGSAYVFTESAGAWSQVATLTANGGAQYDQFGISVAIDGGTIVVGADRATTTQNGNSIFPTYGPGAAYVFTGSGSSWSESAELTGSGVSAVEQFGVSVAIDGGTIVVGADTSTVNGNTGEGVAFVYLGAGSNWNLNGRLEANDGASNANFGQSVSISGDTIVVGAGNANGGAGAAYVFDYEFIEPDPAGNIYEWVQADELTGSEKYFGSSVAISDDTIVVGAEGDFLNPSSLTTGYVFTLSLSGWSQAAALTAAFGVPLDGFASAVAIDGTTIVIGAPDTTVGTNDQQGAAYVFGTPTTVTGLAMSSGPVTGGTTVTITGSGFLGSTQVDFGATPAADFTIDSDSQITATSPAGTGTVNVTVLKPNANSAVSLFDQFNYVAARGRDDGDDHRIKFQRRHPGRLRHDPGDLLRGRFGDGNHRHQPRRGDGHVEHHSRDTGRLLGALVGRPVRVRARSQRVGRQPGLGTGGRRDHGDHHGDPLQRPRARDLRHGRGHERRDRLDDSDLGHDTRGYGHGGRDGDRPRWFLTPIAGRRIPLRERSDGNRRQSQLRSGGRRDLGDHHGHEFHRRHSGRFRHDRGERLRPCLVYRDHRRQPP